MTFRLFDPVLGDVTMLVLLAAICALVLVVWPAAWLLWQSVQRWRGRRYIRRTLRSITAARLRRVEQPPMVGDRLLDAIRKRYEPNNGMRMVKR